MLDLLLTLLTGQAGANLRLAIRHVIFGAVSLTFALIAITAGHVAMFLALRAAVGALNATLIVAGVAAALAVLSSIPLWRWFREPPPSPAATLVQVALAAGLGLMAQRRGAHPPPQEPPHA